MSRVASLLNVWLFVVVQYPDMSKTMGEFTLDIKGGEFTDSEIMVMLGENGEGFSLNLCGQGLKMVFKLNFSDVSFRTSFGGHHTFYHFQANLKKSNLKGVNL